MTRQEILNKTIDFDDAIERIVSLEKQIDELKQENLENESEAREVNFRFDKLLKKYMCQKSQFTNAKEIMQKLIANAPDTYSGTNIELQQKKMFSFQDAVNKAKQFLNGSKQEE